MPESIARFVREYKRFLALVLGLALVLTGCRLGPAGVAPALGESGTVNMVINVPRKVTKATRKVYAATDEGSTLLADSVQVALNGPGFYTQLYPQGEGWASGTKAIDSGSATAHIDNVPKGKNRFVKVIAKNGAQKLNQVGGVLTVVPGYYNHVVIGLATTPLANIIEKLAVRVPEQAMLVDAPKVQAWLDDFVTKPIKNDPNRQNEFDGVHPYLVNADALATFMIASAMQPPVDFDLTRPYPAFPDKTYKLQAGSVRVETDGLPVGSKVWLNDPTSAIAVTTIASQATVIINDVAPNFEASPGEAAPPPWTLTVLTPDGRVSATDVMIPRESEASPAIAQKVFDLRTNLQAANAAITSIELTTQCELLAPAKYRMNGTLSRQVFVKARNSQGLEVMLLPTALDWASLDPRIAVGNGTPLSAGNLAPLGPPGAALVGANSGDHGVVTPVSETLAGDPNDVASIRATVKGTAVSATLGFRIGYLGNNSSRVKINVESDGIKIAQGNQALAFVGQQVPLTVVETAATDPVAPSDIATPVYRWSSDNPAVSVGAGTGRTITMTATKVISEFFPARVSVYSSTGRVASILVHTLNPNGTINGSVQVPSQFQFEPLLVTNPASPQLTADATTPLGAYLNQFAAEATLTANEPQFPADESFVWKSSDPFTISVSSPTLPSKTAKLVALRPGTVTITATDKVGRTNSVVVKSLFNLNGTANGTIQTDNDIITLVGADETTLVAALNGLAVSGVYEAQQTQQVNPVFFWRSLDPTTLQIDVPAVGQTFPNARAKLTALRPGPVSFQVISKQTGQVKTFTLNLVFTQMGTATGTIKVVNDDIDLANGVTPASIALDLNALALSGVYEAKQTNQVGPVFNWRSLDPTTLAVLPPDGQAFPNARAKLTALRPGPVSFQVISMQTGQVKNFTVTLNFSSNGTANRDITVYNLIVSQIAPVPPAGSTGTTVICKNLGEKLTLGVTDFQQAGGNFLWTSDTPGIIAVHSQAGATAVVRPMAYGIGTIRVYNTVNGKVGTLRFDVRSTGSGTSTVNVTL